MKPEEVASLHDAYQTRWLRGFRAAVSGERLGDALRERGAYAEGWHTGWWALQDAKAQAEQAAHEWLSPSSDARQGADS